MRPVLCLVGLLAACGGHAPDGSPGEAGSATGAAALSGEDIHKLFKDAALCGDRYTCPPWDKLQQLAESGEREVAGVAFDIMMQPDARRDWGEGKAAPNIVGWWIDARLERGALDDEAKRWVVERARALVTDGSPKFRIAGIALLGRRGIVDAPGSLAFLQEVCLGPAYDEELMRAAAEYVGSTQQDMTLAHAWIGGADERSVQAGLALLPHIDHRVVDGLDEENRLLLAAAKRSELSAETAVAVLDRIEFREEAKLVGACEALTHHADAGVATRAEELKTRLTAN